MEDAEQTPVESADQTEKPSNRKNDKAFEAKRAAYKSLSYELKADATNV